jgi:hypothetical protein
MEVVGKTTEATCSVLSGVRASVFKVWLEQAL